MLTSSVAKFNLVRVASNIDVAWLRISAGASAPEVVVNEIIEAFRARFDTTIELAETTVENEHFLVNRQLRDVELTVEDMAFVNGR